jgi:hypothetical protein
MSTNLAITAIARSLLLGGMPVIADMRGAAGPIVAIAVTTVAVSLIMWKFKILKPFKRGRHRIQSSSFQKAEVVNQSASASPLAAVPPPGVTSASGKENQQAPAASGSSFVGASGDDSMRSAPRPAPTAQGEVPGDAASTATTVKNASPDSTKAQPPAGETSAVVQIDTSKITAALDSIRGAVVNATGELHAMKKIFTLIYNGDNNSPLGKLVPALQRVLEQAQARTELEKRRSSDVQEAAEIARVAMTRAETAVTVADLQEKFGQLQDEFRRTTEREIQAAVARILSERDAELNAEWDELSLQDAQLSASEMPCDELLAVAVLAQELAVSPPQELQEVSSLARRITADIRARKDLAQVAQFAQAYRDMRSRATVKEKPPEPVNESAGVKTIRKAPSPSQIRVRRREIESLRRALEYRPRTPGAAATFLREARAELLRALDLIYISSVNTASYTPGLANPVDAVTRALNSIGLRLTNIRIGHTVAESRTHLIEGATSDNRFQPGTIASVIGMGYTDEASGEVVQARVLVSPE